MWLERWAESILQRDSKKERAGASYSRRPSCRDHSQREVISAWWCETRTSQQNKDISCSAELQLIKGFLTIIFVLEDHPVSPSHSDLNHHANNSHLVNLDGCWSCQIVGKNDIIVTGVIEKSYNIYIPPFILFTWWYWKLNLHSLAISVNITKIRKCKWQLILYCWATPLNSQRYIDVGQCLD